MKFKINPNSVLLNSYKAIGSKANWEVYRPSKDSLKILSFCLTLILI